MRKQSDAGTLERGVHALSKGIKNSLKNISLAKINLKIIYMPDLVLVLITDKNINKMEAVLTLLLIYSFNKHLLDAGEFWVSKY